MIKIENLRMTYRSGTTEHLAVNDVSLSIEDGQFYTLLGPSGCGKTTTLRCVAGLERPDSGEIIVGDEIVFSSSKNIWVPPYARQIGMVFQSYAIWPHMSVFDNVAFPLRHLHPKPSRSEIRERVTEALALVQLDGLADRPAPYLSGGQQQRLALARALVARPRVLLLDEPLSNLDAKLREDMRAELRKLVERLNLTTLFVTHEQIEALTMSDVVAVMNKGRMVQEASPSEIYYNPTGAFVADFIGKSNFIKATVSSHVAAEFPTARVDSALGTLACRIPQGMAVGTSILVAIRPENVAVQALSGTASENVVRGTVEELHFLGNFLECVISAGSESLLVQLHPQDAPEKGETIAVHLPVAHCFAILDV
jgi:iron(III) transport system ATP-binding protein